MALIGIVYIVELEPAYLSFPQNTDGLITIMNFYHT